MCNDANHVYIPEHSSKWHNHIHATWPNEIYNISLLYTIRCHLVQDLHPVIAKRIHLHSSNPFRVMYNWKFNDYCQPLTMNGRVSLLLCPVPSPDLDYCIMISWLIMLTSVSSMVKHEILHMYPPDCMNFTDYIQTWSNSPLQVVHHTVYATAINIYGTNMVIHSIQEIQELFTNFTCKSHPSWY
jgi:hypothetical protein